MNAAFLVSAEMGFGWCKLTRRTTRSQEPRSTVARRCLAITENNHAAFAFARDGPRVVLGHHGQNTDPSAEVPPARKRIVNEARRLAEGKSIAWEQDGATWLLGETGVGNGIALSISSLFRVASPSRCHRGGSNGGIARSSLH